MLRKIDELKEDVGPLTDLSCPVLSKLAEAFYYAAHAHNRRSAGPGFRAIDGKNGVLLQVGFVKQGRTLVLAFRTPTAAGATSAWSKELSGTAWQDNEPPHWLRHVRKDALVHARWNEVFNDFLTPPQHLKKPALSKVIKRVTGGVTARRVLCTGFCIGGSIAQLAACWAALQLPTADVRCITFGALATGNAHFVDAFRWLVAVSYRVVLAKDPVPAKAKPILSTLHHVHGAVYLEADSIQHGGHQDPAGSYRKDEHDIHKYGAGVGSFCHRLAHMERLDSDHASQAALLPDSPTSQGEQPGQPIELTSAQEILAVRAEDMPHVERQEVQRVAQGLAGEVAAMMQRMHLDGAGQADAQSEATASMAAENGIAGLHGQHHEAGPGGEGQRQHDPQQPTAAVAATPAQAPTSTLEQGLDSTAAAALHAWQAQQQQQRQQRVGSGARGPLQRRMSPRAPLTPFDHGAGGAAQPAMPNIWTVSPRPRDSAVAEAEVVSLGRSIAHLTGTGQGGGSSPQALASQQPAADLPGSDQESVLELMGSASSTIEPEGMEGMDSEEEGVCSPAPPRQAAALTLKLSGTPSTAARSTGLQGSGPVERTVAETMQQSAGGNGLQSAEDRKGEAAWLQRSWSMLDCEDVAVDRKSVRSLEKVLMVGKINPAVVCSAAAYHSEAVFQAITGLANSRVIDRDKSQVHVAWLDSSTAVFAFRGTATAHDRLQDVKILSRSIDFLSLLAPGAKAHFGFLQQFRAVCSPDDEACNMAAMLRTLSGGRQPTRVLLCGHSLGGALATLGAVWAAIEWPTADIRCVTFGSPRVGNKAFRKAFHTLVGTSLRVVHGLDPVPALPPSMLFHHVNNVMLVSMKGAVKFKHRPWHVALRLNLAHHAISHYMHTVFFHVPGGKAVMPQLPAASSSSAAAKADDHGMQAAADMMKGGDEQLQQRRRGEEEEDLSDEEDSMPAAAATRDASEVVAPAAVARTGKTPSKQASSGLFSCFRGGKSKSRVKQDGDSD